MHKKKIAHAAVSHLCAAVRDTMLNTSAPVTAVAGVGVPRHA
jgi:hypothetical protein